MMPGENHSKVAEIASDATSGTCQNCTVLNQSLDEYVAALLTLKQKIIDTDRLLSEYKEKCDELQKSHRESSKLHRQLDDVLLKLEPLEKQTAEYEHTKTELEKTKADLRCYQQKCEDVEKLRADNAQTLLLKDKVEESLRKAEDTVQRQNLENETLRAQQKTLEEDLQKAQDSLEKYLEIAEEVENLKLENAKSLILKGNIENELLVLKEIKLQQSNEILYLKKEKTSLEEVLHTTQQRLNTLEKEFNKEKRSTSSQTDAELHIDKGKVRKLLEELWRCVEPSSQTNERLLLNEEPTPLKPQLNRTPPQQVLTSPLRQPSLQTNKQLLHNGESIPLTTQLNRTPPQQVLTSPLREPSLQTSEWLLLNGEPTPLKTQLNRTPPQQVLASPLREPSSQTNKQLLHNGEPTNLKTQLNRTPPQQVLASPLREPSSQTNKQLLHNGEPTNLKTQLNRTPPQQVLASPLREPSSQTNKQLLHNEEPTSLKTQLNRTPPQQVLASPLRTQDFCPSPWKQSPKTHPLSSNLLSTRPEASPEIIIPKSSPQSLVKPNKEQHSSTRSRKRKVRSDALEHVDRQSNEVHESSQKEINNKDLLHEDYYPDFEDITEWFRPLPEVLSPVQSPLTELVCSNDDQPVLDILHEDQPEALSNSHILKNTTYTDIENQKSQEVETPSVFVSSLTHLNTESVDNLDLENTSFDNQCMEVEDMSEDMCDTQNPAAQPYVENVDTVESSLEEDPKQAVEEDLLVNQNLYATQFEAIEVTNIAINSTETSNPQPDSISTNSVESADYNHSQIQSLKSNENSVTTLDVSCSRLDDPKNEELKPPVHLEIRTVTDISTHDIQTNTLTNALIEHQKSSDEKEKDVFPLKSSKDKESSSSDDEGHFGLKRKVRRVRSRSEARISSEELDDVSETVQRFSANHLSKDELSENTDKSYSGLSTGNMKPDDEQEAKSSDTETVQLVCKSQINGTEDTQEVDDSDNLRKTSLQMNDRSRQQNEMLIEDLSSGIESFDSNVYNNSVASGDSAEDCPEGTGTPCHINLDAGNSETNEEKVLLVPDLNTKAHVTPPPCLSLVRTEMGPPLPPVVMPLTATPPRFVRHHTPSRPTPSRLASDGPKSPKNTTSVPVINSALPDASKMSPCLTTPSPSCGVPSSPLQFGSATPKHAVPVPGRLPSSAISSSPPSASQENSMQMLDSMYPELSARARTLNILRGNVNLNRAGSENGASPTSINQISGNKSISSSSTAFTKTEQKPKRTGVNMLLPKSAKRLRLDNCSPAPSMVSPAEQVMDHQPLGVIKTDSSKSHLDIQRNQTNLKVEEKPDTKKDCKQIQISEALAKIATASFEVLPVVKSHVFLGRISQQPILIDEEKAVIADFSSSAEDLMSAILTKLKMERSVLSCANLQALCRVYTGLCRQMGDYQKAHAFAYSILKEDFPDACKLILFMVTTWPSVLLHETSLCRAIQTVAKLKAEGEILEYLTKYLHWDKNPPHDISEMVSSTVKALREDKDLTFQKHHRHGHDLCPAAWEYVYTLDLLCTRMKWKWTHDFVIGKELWPIMNAWVTQKRPLQTPVRDVSVAAVLRIIGRLGQLGIKQRLIKSVQNVAKAINLFGKHGITEGVPDEVQLSAVYAIYDLAPCNPKEALDALASWRSETSQQVPAAVTSCITQIGSLCRQIKS